MPENPHPPENGPLPRRRRYRTRMFDNRLSFPTTSAQVRQLQAESDADKGEASLPWSARPSTGSFPGCGSGGGNVGAAGPRRRPLRIAPQRARAASSKRPGVSWAIPKNARRGSGAMVLCGSISRPGFGRTLKREKSATSWSSFNRDIEDRPGRGSQMGEPLERRTSGMTRNQRIRFPQAGDRRPRNNIH